MCGYGMQQLEERSAGQDVFTVGCLEQIIRWAKNNLLLVAGLTAGLLLLEVTPPSGRQVQVTSEKYQTMTSKSEFKVFEIQKPWEHVVSSFYYIIRYLLFSFVSVIARYAPRSRRVTFQPDSLQLWLVPAEKYASVYFWRTPRHAAQSILDKKAVSFGASWIQIFYRWSIRSKMLSASNVSRMHHGSLFCQTLL